MEISKIKEELFEELLVGAKRSIKDFDGLCDMFFVFHQVGTSIRFDKLCWSEKYAIITSRLLADQNHREYYVMCCRINCRSVNHVDVIDDCVVEF